MAVGNLMDASSPYVHSNIYHIIGSVKDYFGNGDQTARKEIEETIRTFESWIDQLQAYEQEIYSFCGVGDFQALNAKLFGSEQDNKIMMAARSVVLESDTMLRLIPTITKKQIKAISDAIEGVNLGQYLNLDSTNEFTLSETRNAILEALTNMFSSTKGEQIVKADAMNVLVGSAKFKKSVSNDLADWVGRAAVQSKSKSGKFSRGSKMYQLATSILKNKIGGFKIPYSKFQQVFIEKFKERVIRDQLVLPVDKTLEQLAEDTCREIYHYLFEGKILTDIANILGERGEGMLGYTIDNTGFEEVRLQIEVIPTGKEDEEKIANAFKNELNVAASKIKMTDYSLNEKGSSNQSKSDMIIKIIGSNGTKIFRVQSKDFLIKRLENANQWDSVPQTIRMLDNNVSKILELLSEKTIIGQESINTLSYYIANMTWFNRYGSYDGETATKRNRGSGSTGGIGGMQEAINQIVSQGIQAFIGVTIQDAIEEKPLPINTFASNVFYFLGSRTLFPVSEVLKAAVDQMRGFSQLLFSTRFVIDTGSASFHTEGAEAFWNEKRERVSGGSFGAATYTDAGLVSVGKEQGATIISTVKGHINFNFDIGRILSISSYVF